MKINICLAQMNLIIGNPAENVQQAEQMIVQAAEKGSQIILFPELWTCGYDLPSREKYSQENDKIIPTLSKLAFQHQIWLGGSLLIKRDQHFFNTFHLFPPDGSPAFSYDKIHLFRLMDEDQWFSSGEKIRTLPLPWGLTGLAICYDLRFPELFRQQALIGAKIFLLVSQWPIQRIDHWKTLLRARAIENQAFMAAVNSVGVIGDAVYGGSSAVISPWGETIIEGSTNQPEILYAELDIDQVDRVRSKIPVFTDRRADLYDNEITR